MSLASYRALGVLRHSVSCSKKFVQVSHHVRNASKAAGTPGISGLGGKVGKVTAGVIDVKVANVPVETNVERLQTHLCGSNILKEGGEDVQLKPDSEYPDWLWKMNVGPEPHYTELSPDDKRYWLTLRKIYHEQQKRIKERKRF